MEKETVLEIEFQPVFDKWAWKVTKNKIIGGKIEDNEIETSIYIDCNNFANIDLDKEDSYLITTNCLVNKAMKDRLEYIVEKVNEKYGIIKRWRAENEGWYYYILSNYSLVVFAIDHRFTDDNNRYETGNYFKTKEEAKEYAEYIKKCSLEWHEKREKNE
jgi:conserved domain protein